MSLESQILEILVSYVSPVLSKSILTLSKSWSHVDPATMRSGDDIKLLRQLSKGIKVYIKAPELRSECEDRLEKLLAGHKDIEPEPSGQTVVEITEEAHIVSSRSLGRELCRRLGFSSAVQIKVATAISELARNIRQYAGNGTITIAPISGRRRGIEVIAKDNGPGIKDIERILSGDYRSESGMGIGLMGTQKMMDEFEIDSGPDKGTFVRVRKYLS